MKALKIISIVFICIVHSSCISSPDAKRKADTNHIIIISVKNNIDNILQYDSLFSSINVVPLETDSACLLGQVIKALCYSERIYILDNLKKLTVFNLDGKYLYTVGKEGRGPGEYLELRDFDIDDSGNIYILSYKEILQYNSEGVFLSKTKFNFDKYQIHCNPLEFGINKNGNFYLWGGSFGIKENPVGRRFAMYEIGGNGKIVNSYFPLKYNTTQSFERHRFSRYKDATLIEPYFGVNTIYSLGEGGVKPVYEIDFGNKNIQYPIPEGFDSSAEFKLKVDQIACHSIEAVIETDKWVYFRFLHKMKRYNAFYSKKNMSTFVSRSKYPNNLTIPLWITSKCNDDFISFCDPQVLINYVNENIDNSRFTGKIKEQISHLEETDNPVILSIKMKEY